MMKKRLYILFIISALALSITAIIGSKQEINFAQADFECEHYGYHYDELLPEIGVAGHHEFWTCCKCQKAFLEKPAVGEFVDQDDDLMSGGLAEDHIAYISPIQYKSLTVNGHRYYPIFKDNPISHSEVVFYDDDFNELPSTGITGYEMSDLVRAKYYIAKDSVTFDAVSYIENVSYNDVFNNENIGANTVKEAFLDAYDIDDSVTVETLVDSSDVYSVEVPKIRGVSLNSIWSTYNYYGFAPSSNAFWSCVSYNLMQAYCFKLDYSMWMRSNCASSNGMSICLSKTFNLFINN